MAIRIGCGSWSDAEYRGVLYPRGLPPGERLRVYATIFNHVEVNSTYYGAPKPEAVAQWIAATPPGFLFDIKLHRVFSQSPAKAAIGAKNDLLAYTLERLQPVRRAGKLGAFLLLLTGRFSPGRHALSELTGLVERLKPHRLAVELRDPAWMKGREREKTLAFFRETGIAWVAVDLPQEAGLMPAIDEVTVPDLAYLRLHGRNRKGYLHGKSAAEQHDYAYSEKELRRIVDRIKKLAARASEVRVVANNHAHDFAPRTALRLRELLGLPTVVPFSGDGPKSPRPPKQTKTPRKTPSRSARQSRSAR